MNIEALRQEAIDLILGMTDEECAVILEVMKMHMNDKRKTPDECLNLAIEKLGYPGGLTNG